MRKKVSLVLVLLCVSSIALAVSSPISLLQNASNRMLDGLHQRQGHITTSYVYELVNHVLLPIISVNQMAGSVLGRQYWNSATPAQRRTFVHQFKNLVIATYASALQSYNNDKVNFYPLRGGYNHQIVTVNSVIVRANGQRIPVSYNLVRAGDSWRIYDFSIENVSMVQSYRSQFASTLQRGGVGALIKKLKSRR